MTKQFEWTCKECDADNAVCGCKQDPVAWRVSDDTTEPELYQSYHSACQDAWDADFGTLDPNSAIVEPLYVHPPIDPKAHMRFMVVSAYEAGQYFMQEENTRLRTALMDAINKPKGVVPVSAEEFYSG